MKKSIICQLQKFNNKHYIARCLRSETAMRRGEMLSVKWSDIKGPGRILRIQKTTIVGMFRCRPALNGNTGEPSAEASDDDLVFPIAGKPWHKAFNPCYYLKRV